MGISQRILKKILVASLILWTIPICATVYEDAEDNATTGWVTYGRKANATIENVYDAERGSQVIKLTGKGKKTGYRIGNRSGRANSWNNKTEKVLQWSMKYNESFRIYVSILTKRGNRFLVYTNQSENIKGKFRRRKVRYGLGKDSADGTWHTFTRDLEADWNDFMPRNPMIAVNGFFIKGSGSIDDISLLSEGIKPPTDKHIYEDAEDNTTTGWVTYGRRTNATIENVYDAERGSRVIKLTGDGKKTGYRIGNRSGRAKYVGAWNNRMQKVLQWSMKYSEDFRIYIPISTKRGNRFLVYTNQSENVKGKIRGGKVRYGLGEDSADGTWHTFTRDLEADWNAFKPKNPLISVNGFFIKGSGSIDDISLSVDISPVNDIPSTPGPYIGITDINKTSVRVNFLDNADNEDGFLLFDDSGDINVTLPKNSATAPSQTYVTLTGLTCDRTYTIKALAFNGSGNSATSDARAFNIHSTFGVTCDDTPVADTTKPVITLNGATTITLTKGSTYTELGATAIDDRDGNVSVSISGTVDVNAVGTYTITYKAKDSAGNEAVAIRTVKVIEVATTNIGFEISKVRGNTASYNAIADFDVALKSKPSADVTIPISSSDESEGLPMVSSLTFTPNNWNQPQSVVVKGRNSNVVNGVQEYQIILGSAQSSDSRYDGLDPDDVDMKGIYLKLNDVTDSTKFIAGLESTISMNIEYTGNNKLVYSLEDKPDGMNISSTTGVISWTAPQSAEGNSYDVKVKVTDGRLVSNISFNVSVAGETPIESEQDGNHVTITEQGNLHGLVVTKIDDKANIEDIEFKKIPTDSTRKIPSFVTKITDTFVIDKKIDGKIKVKLPLSALPSGTDLHYVFLYTLTKTLHSRTAFWSPTLIDRDISTINGEPTIEITLTGLHGVYFIGIEDKEEEIETSVVQQTTNRRILSKTDLSKITCKPEKDNDYMTQICSYSDDVDINITVINFGHFKYSTRWWSLTTAKKMVGWLIDAQKGFEKLGLNYDKDFTVLIDAIRVDKDNHIVHDPKAKESSTILGYVTAGFNENRKTIHLTRRLRKKNSMQGTVVHEYLHQAQARSRIDKKDLLINGGKEVNWFIEGTAKWFEDFLLTPDSQEYDKLNTYASMKIGERILEVGLGGFNEKGEGIYSPYQRFSFFKLLNHKCNHKGSKFEDIFRKLLNINKTKDPYGIINLSNELENANCNFGNQLGKSKKSSLESALLYYQYATIYKNKISLLDPNETDKSIWAKLGGFGFGFKDTIYKYSKSNWAKVDEDELPKKITIPNISSVPKYGAYSIKIDKKLLTYANYDEGQEVLFRVKTKKGNLPLIVSLLSEDNDFKGNSKLDKLQHIHYKTNEKSEYVFSKNALSDYFITIVNPNNEDVYIDEEDGIAFEVRNAFSTKVKKTGQTISYYPKDDGDYQKGVTPSYTRDNEKEIVTDHITNLQWQDNEDVKTVMRNWQDAKEYCSNLNLGGYSDWRLPTVVELQSIVVDGSFPAIDTTVFLNHTPLYGEWSSTTRASRTSNAWIVSLGHGNIDSRLKSDNEAYVRCVRTRR